MILVKIKTRENMLREYGGTLKNPNVMHGYNLQMERGLPKNRIIEIDGSFMTWYTKDNVWHISKDMIESMFEGGKII